MDRETMVLLGIMLLALVVVAPPRPAPEPNSSWSFAEYGGDQGPAILQVNIAAGQAPPPGPTRRTYLAMAPILR